jgi:glyoxylase-like metal-dependent hydrolase (beta-lactamase superfamily II)
MLATNCYIVACSRTREGLVIDPGEEPSFILEILEKRGISVTMIVLTHAHFDHTGAATALQQATGAPVAIHAEETDLLARPRALFPGMRPPAPISVDRVLQTGETLDVGDLRVRVLATPGHSPGGISLYLEREQVVFSGDALFREGIGRTDFPGSSGFTLSTSIRTQLYTLPDETIVYAGHGPQTTIGWEKRHNPFVRPLG